MTTGTLDATTPDQAIVAGPGRYYRNMRYLFVAGMLAMAAWFGYDGWVRYPRERALHQQNPHAGAPHSDMDINLQRVLACALPPAALLFLGWTLYNTRGTYRLSGDVLSVLDIERRSHELLVQSFHLFDENQMVIKTQGIIEVVKA